MCYFKRIGESRDHSWNRKDHRDHRHEKVVHQHRTEPCTRGNPGICTDSSHWVFGGKGFYLSLKPAPQSVRNTIVILTNIMKLHVKSTWINAR